MVRKTDNYEGHTMKRIDADEFRTIIKSNGGLEHLRAFGVFSQKKGDAMMYGPTAQMDITYTEWGRAGDEAPLVAEEKKGDTWSYWKFIPTG